jgi:IgGFc binding protein
LVDGGDRVQSSLPITLTRGAYPWNTFAGATDCMDVASWGRSFIVPAGPSTSKNLTGVVNTRLDPFEYAAAFVMAAVDNTVVTLPNSSTVTLNMGQSTNFVVDMGQTISASQNVQVNLVTGDVNDKIEMRWFTILPTEDSTYMCIYVCVSQEESNCSLVMIDPIALGINDCILESCSSTRLTKFGALALVSFLCYSCHGSTFCGCCCYNYLLATMFQQCGRNTFHRLVMAGSSRASTCTIRTASPSK